MASNTSWRWSDTLALRELTLSITPIRTGRTSGELYQDIQNDYGSCGRRRFARVLKFLVDGGFLTPRKEFRDEFDQYVTVYRRSRKPLALIPHKITRSCTQCGMIGTDAQSHPLHLHRIRQLRGSAPAYIKVSPKLDVQTAVAIALGYAQTNHLTMRRIFRILGWYYTSVSRCAARYRNLVKCSQAEAGAMFGISKSSVRDVSL